MNRDRPPIDYGPYQESFNARCIEWRSEPVEDRKCNDVFCLPVLLLMVLALFGVGGYYVHLYHSEYSPNLSADDATLDISKYAVEIITCLGVSVILSFLYIFLLRLYPKVMVYTMIGLTLGLLAVLAIAGIFMGQIGITIGMGITLLIYALVLFCFRKKIQTGIVLVKVATNFMASRISVFLTPIVKVVLAAIIGGFWIYCMSAIVFIANEQDNRG